MEWNAMGKWRCEHPLSTFPSAPLSLRFSAQACEERQPIVHRESSRVREPPQRGSRARERRKAEAHALAVSGGDMQEWIRRHVRAGFDPRA